jgi:ubiquinone/menaquinone biosynthesis C-methylase UbiE
MQWVYRRLIDFWFDSTTHGLRLKTDLFEESISPYAPLLDLGRAVGIDGSYQVSRNAHNHMLAYQQPAGCVVADLRRIPFRGGSFDGILSGSSLDHFHGRNDIRISLAELARLLQPGGVLIITFDNPHNPLVWLRNHLPFNWLNRIGLVPYYVGATYT